MLTEEQFITIMKSLEKIDKVIHGLQDLFDFNMDDGPLVRAWDDLLNLVVDEMEVNINDELGPVTLQYAFAHNWGENEFTLNIDDTTSFKIKDLETLYIYLTMKYINDIENQIGEIE
jgi:hypothetical protein